MFFGMFHWKAPVAKSYLNNTTDHRPSALLRKDMIRAKVSRKRSSYLVRIKLYTLESTVGSKKCSKKRCEVCEYIQNLDAFRSSATSEAFTINRQLNCDA